MPDSLHSLLEYLRENPFVEMQTMTSFEGRKYKQYDKGNIYWIKEDGRVATTPIMCPLADGKLHFSDDSFSFEAYGVMLLFKYKETA